MLLGKSQSASQQAKGLNATQIAHQSLCLSNFNLQRPPQPFYTTQKRQTALSTANSVALVYI